MKKMLKRLNSQKGFTLAELLIVVAIIAVLVAISIPVFNSQLEKSREATDEANIRAAYSEVMAAALTETVAGTTDGKVNVTVANGVTTATKTVKTVQTTAGWSGEKPTVGGLLLTDAEAPAAGEVTITATSGGAVTIGTVSNATTTP